MNETGMWAVIGSILFYVIIFVYSQILYADIRPKKKPIARKELFEVLSSDDKFACFLKDTYKRYTTPMKSRIERRTGCWSCKSVLSTKTHLVCPICGWIICDCGKCSRGSECHRSWFVKNKNHIKFFIDNRNQILNYFANNFIQISKDIGSSDEITDLSILNYIFLNHSIIFAGYYDRDGYDIYGYNKDGYDRQGKDKCGFFKDGYNDAGYNRLGYNREGYDKYGYNKQGYDASGYNRLGYNREGYDKYGYNKQGYDKEGFDKNGYNVEGYNRNGFDKYGYNKEGYDGEGYNKKGYNKDGYDCRGLDNEGYNKEGFNAKGFDREGYSKRGNNKYGWNKSGYHKDGRYCEIIGKKVIHISCGEGTVVDFYREEDTSHFVVEYKNKSTGKFIYSKKVLAILDFGDYAPKFD
ncbi:MAG: hypothetical protein IIW73_07390 [Clostridia bacterium]|nr:hypothetical protein [Clostridia bacterium]